MNAAITKLCSDNSLRSKLNRYKWAAQIMAIEAGHTPEGNIPIAKAVHELPEPTQAEKKEIRRHMDRARARKLVS